MIVFIKRDNPCRAKFPNGTPEMDYLCVMILSFSACRPVGWGLRLPGSQPVASCNKQTCLCAGCTNIIILCVSCSEKCEEALESKALGWWGTN